MDSRALERRYGFNFHEMIPTSVGDIDGNGHPELFLTKRWNPLKGQILWNVSSSSNRLTTLPTNSQIGGQRFLDFDGDGKDELIVSFTGWSLYGVNIYKGQDAATFDIRNPRFELLGSCGKTYIHQPDRTKFPELLVTADRSQEQDIISIYGEDLAPEKSDGLYSIRWTGKDYVFKPLFMLPFEKRREQSIHLTVSLASMFPEYPDSFLVRSQENVKGKNNFMTISSGNGRASVVLKPKYGGQTPFVIDIDKDGDQELVWIRTIGNRKHFVVWGLKDKVESVQVEQVKGVHSARREQSPELIALDLLRAGQAQETLSFLETSLVSLARKSNERIRLLFLKARALASLGQLFEARALCQSIVNENERWAIKALKQAALYSEQMQDYKNAVADLKKLQSAFVLDDQMTLEVDRLLSRLGPLASLRPTLQLNSSLIRDPKVLTEVINPWYFELKDGRINSHLKNLSKASLNVPIGQFTGDSLRFQSSFQMKALDLSRNGYIRIYNTKDHLSYIQLAINCHGGGDERSFQRKLTVFVSNHRALHVYINEMGDFHFDPNANIHFDLIYSQQSGFVQAQIKCGDVVWKKYAFLPPTRLTPGPYRLEIGHKASTGSDHIYVGAALKLAFQSITISMPEYSLKPELTPTPKQLGLAGRDWLIKDYQSANKKLDLALNDIAAKLLDPA
ncbi:MAG: hypothetical protein P1V97_39675, partial [Planctomycetota bacterium]|nr:hypothetical protein [Planctomycetota bacterium]